MANRIFYPSKGCLEIDVCELFCEINIGSTGAVSSSSGKGIASVVRNSAGKYTITLSDSYNKLLWADVAVLDDTNSDPVSVGTVGRLFSEDVDGSTPTLAIQFYDFTDGSAADPADGAKVFVKIQLRNSSVE